MSKRTDWLLILVVLLLIWFLRVGLSFLTVHVDVATQSEWGRWMYERNNTKGLYDWGTWSGMWPNHPPLISYLYFLAYKIHSMIMWKLSVLGNFIALNRIAPTKFMWLFNFTKWFGSQMYGNSNLMFGPMIVIKQFMILADLAIAVVLGRLSQKYSNYKLKYALIYLFLPFSWYLSSIWGQSDQLSFLFLVLSLLALYKKPTVSIILYFLSVNFKPTAILLLPVYIGAYYIQKHKFFTLIWGGLVSMLASFWFVSWYTDSNPFLYFLTTLLKRMATTSERLTTSSAFNFWYLIHPFPSVVVFSSDVFMGLPYKVWGWIIFAIVTWSAVKLIKNNKLYSLLAGMFVVSFGGYLFLTEMHERYAFSGIALLLFLAVIKKKYFKYFLALSTIYFINLVWVFSFPQSLDRIKVLFMLEYQIIPRILSFLNVAIFLKIFKLLLNERQTEAT